METATTSCGGTLSKPLTNGNELEETSVGILLPLLPWGVITEYMLLKEIAHTRLVSPTFNHLLCDAVSPVQCAQYLSSKLVQQNCHILTQTTSDKWIASTIQNVDKLTQMLSIPSSSSEIEPMASSLSSLSATHQRKRQQATINSRKPSAPRRTHSNSSNISMETSSTANSVMSMASTARLNPSICNMSTTSPSMPLKDHKVFSPSPLRMLLYTLRIIQCIPEQAAVAFNRTHGRHLLPMEWNEKKNAMQVASQERVDDSRDVSTKKLVATNRKCRIPTIISVSRRTEVASHEEIDVIPPPTNNIDDYFTIQADTSDSSMSVSRTIARNVGADGNRPSAAAAKSDCDTKSGHDEILDLKHYYNTGAPNLPNLLTCPRCGLSCSKQRTGHRTMVLSEISYQSSRASVSSKGAPENFVASPNQTDLTLSPQASSNNGDGNKVNPTAESAGDGNGNEDFHRYADDRGCKESQEMDEENESVDIANDDDSIEIESLVTPSPTSTISRKRLKLCEDGSNNTARSLYQGRGNGKPRCKSDDSSERKKATGLIPPFPPPLYCDMAIPHRSTPIPYKRDDKHAISIHCSSCNEFGILAPASVCWDLSFPCHQRGFYLNDQQQQEGSEEDAKKERKPLTATQTALQLDEKSHGKSEDVGSCHQMDPTMIGGMIVRTRCSTSGCERPTLCWQCHHAIWHEPYDDGGTNWMDVSQSNLGSPTIRHSSHCPSCRETYCHEHAWLCTICHHW